MQRRLVLLGLLAGSAAGCARISGSRLNPFTWFGRSSSAPVSARATARAVVDPRPLAAEVVGLRVDRTPEGAIVTATALPARQGHWDAGLVAVAADPGTLAFQFRLSPPPGRTRVSTPQSREVSAAAFLDMGALAGITEIRVEGARSARSVRR